MRTAVAVLLAGSIAAGCGNPPPPVEPPSAAPAAGPLTAVVPGAVVLRRGNGGEPETLDPHRAQSVPAQNILRDLFEGLTAEAADGSVIPGAAAHWDISRDGRRYTFYLDPEARWSDGVALSAEDFVYSLRRSADPVTGSPAVQVLSPIVNAAAVFAGRLPPEALGVRALNRRAVQIDLEHPTPYFLGLLALPPAYPLRRASVEAAPDTFTRPGMLIGNGPYLLAEWRVGSRIRLLRNPHYRDQDRLAIDEVQYYPIADPNVELARYRAGDIDWTYDLPNARLDWLRQQFPAALTVAPWLGTYYLGFNLTRPPFAEAPALRRALNLAIDRDLLVDKVTRFGELPSFNLTPPGMSGYRQPQPVEAGWTQNERETEARRLYQEAGYSTTQPLRLELRYNTSANHKKIALAVAAMWRAVLGVETSLLNEEWKVFLQNRQQKRVTEAFRGGWIGDYNDPYAFLEIFHSAHRQNDTGYADPSYDRLLERIAAEPVPVRRFRLLAEAERRLLAAQPVAPLYTYVTKRLVNPRVKGWQHNLMDHHPSRFMYFTTGAEDTPVPPPAAHSGTGR